MRNIVLFLLFTPLLALAQKPRGAQHLVQIGDPAPDFTLTYVDGHQQQLSELNGKVIMLEFTASWCGVCRKEMRFIEREIWQKHKGNRDFVLVGIDLGEGKNEIEKLISGTGITYPILLDPEGTIFERYAEKGAGVTRNYIIGRNGRIAFVTRLFNRQEFDAMKEKIEELLMGKQASRVIPIIPPFIAPVPTGAESREN